MTWRPLVTGAALITATIGVAQITVVRPDEPAQKETVAQAEADKFKPAAKLDNPSQMTSATTVAKRTVNIQDLAGIIRREQRDNVRESYGVWAHQCFSDADLAQFKNEKKYIAIAASLKNDLDFLQILSDIRRIPVAERSVVLMAYRKPLHQTWAQINEISSKGQTEAGQQAEQLIADSIVDALEDLAKAADQPE